MRRGALYLLVLGLILAAVQEPAANEVVSPPGPWQDPPPLGKPAGRVVRVSSEAQLQAAVNRLQSDTTILIEPGTYQLSNTLNLRGGVRNVALRGASDDRTRVVLKGRGMRNKQHGNVPHGIMVSNASDVLIANLSVGDVWFHPITLQGQQGCQRVRVYNVRLFDAGEQFIKSNPDGRGGGVNDSRVEYCLFEFTDTARHNYTEGIDVHTGANWVVRHNLFRNIRGPAGGADVGGCIDFWHGSRNTLVEGNLIVNSRMGIRLGIGNRQQKEGYHDHQGGIVRNNIIWRQEGAVRMPDTGISINDSPGTKVYHNTVFLAGGYPGGIEYRWSRDVAIAHNLINTRVWRRNDAEGREEKNLVITDRKVFVDAAAGDLHLTGQGAQKVGRVSRLEDCGKDVDGQSRPEKTNLGADECSEGSRR